MELLTENEVAERLRVKPRTLQDWRQRDIGPAWARLGGSVRYPATELERYIEAQVHQPARACGS